jgi:TonB family protein
MLYNWQIESRNIFRTIKLSKKMKNIAILFCILLFINPMFAQRWSSAFIGKPESRAMYASNVSKAIQIAWEEEISSKNKTEMLLDEIIFGQDGDKKIAQNIEISKHAMSNIDEIAEISGIKEEEIDPVKKKKLESAVVITEKVSENNKSQETATSALGNIDEVKEAIEKTVPAAVVTDKKSTLIINNNNDIETDTVYAIPEISASFVGGVNAMKQFFAKNIVTPENTGNIVKGKVFVRFMVSRTGELSKIYLVKGLTNECNQEALRVVKKMSNWLPATQNGNRVNSWHTLPIYFEIE